MSELLSELHGQFERSRHRLPAANLLDQNLRGEALGLISYPQEETGAPQAQDVSPLPSQSHVREHTSNVLKNAVAGLEAANCLLSLTLHPNHHFLLFSH